jgi:hypothetical protein
LADVLAIIEREVARPALMGQRGRQSFNESAGDKQNEAGAFKGRVFFKPRIEQATTIGARIMPESHTP